MLTGHAVAARINAFRIRTETIRIPVHLRSKRRERLCLETLRKKLEKLVIKQTFPQQTPFKKKSLIPNRFSSLFPSSFNMKRIFFLSRYCIDTRAVTSHSLFADPMHRCMQRSYPVLHNASPSTFSLFCIHSTHMAHRLTRFKWGLFSRPAEAVDRD